MSKSKSYLPNGGYTLTQGSNYMMDGFQFDTEYNGGPQDKARLPEAKGLSDLPSGMVSTDSSGLSMLPGVQSEFDLNMEEITREASQELTIVDHSWLASEPTPDLSGMAELEQVYKDLEEGHMNSVSHNQLKTLEQSWGNKSTTGLEIIPNENRKHDTYKNTYQDVSELPGDTYREQVEKNVRKLAYGETLNQVLSEVNDEDILQMKVKLSSEYGLHGQVYIKEEYFPGLFNGKWNEVINKRCASAMYIIPKNEDCAYDRFLGMEVVSEVPWSKAAKALLPKLESYGVKLASGSSKDRLQSAFIDLIEGQVERHDKSATWFQTQIDQSSLISLDHAKRELENAREENIFVASVEEVEQTKTQRKLERIAQQLISQRFLESEQVEDVLSTNKSATDKINRLYQLASQPDEVKSYRGQGRNASYHNMRKEKDHSNAHIPKLADREKEKSEKIAMRKISQLVQNGLITYDEVEVAIKGKKSPQAKLSAVFNYLAQPKQSEDYKGQRFEPHVAKKASLPTKTAHEVETWLRQKISEGLAGDDLDVLLSTRFAQNILSDHQDRIASIRSEHEGLSGHAYVDATSYMTSGTEGCEKGALVHRANQIPTLLKTSKCGGCVFNSNGMCQKYNKTIIASANEIVEDPQSYQQEMIRLANASDSEKTASLFVNNYDPNEFNLTANEEVSVDDTPSSDTLGDILFGGFEV